MKELLLDTRPTALFLFGTGFCVTLLWTVIVRVLSGATPASLLESRGYELPPLRGLIHLVHFTLCALCLTFGGVLLVEIYAAFKQTPGPHLWSGAAALAGLAAALVARHFWSRYFVALGENHPPRVAVAEVSTERGISPTRLDRLGQERFPNVLAENWRAELNLRWLLLALSLAVVGFTIYGSAESVRKAPWRVLALQIANSVQQGLTLPNVELSLFVGGVSAIALVTLLSLNRTYQLVTFFRSLIVQPILVVGMLTVPSTQSSTPGVFVWWLAVGVGACAIRWIADLRRCGAYRRMRTVYDAIAAEIEEAVPPLSELTRRDDCRLDPIDEHQLSQRISQGCRNVEDADPLVTRNFARYMSLVNIEYDHFVAAMLRFLTVRRYVSESGGMGTSRPLQDPVVPVWDEQLFPVSAPRGFVDWIDPLSLETGWDRVSLCGTCSGTGRMNCVSCGGSGTVQRAETYTEYSNGQSQSRTRYITEPCGGCGGSGKVTCTSCSGYGRLLFQRTLNTQWQRLFPAVVAPEVPMPELMEDAEERVYYRLPLVEDRTRIDAPAFVGGIGDDLATKLDDAAHKLADSHTGHADRVLKLHDARYLYRADCQFTGFWTLCIDFRRLRGKRGWFFGKRPEFYFPSLPFSWSMLGTIVFLPPTVLLTLPMLIEAFKGLVSVLRPG